MKYLYNPPYIIKKVFSPFRWSTNNSKVLFTFDDGPIPSTTEKILKKLDDLKIKAIFFCVGDNLKKYPELAGMILKQGHLVGNHTYNHKNIRTLNRAETKRQIKMVNEILNEKYDYNPEYFRPPYGKFKISTPGLLKEQKLTGVMWSLLTYDYKNDFNIVKQASDEYLRKDSIVVLHDSIKCTDIILDTIQYISDAAEKKGFTIGEPAECLK